MIVYLHCINVCIIEWMCGWMFICTMWMFVHLNEWVLHCEYAQLKERSNEWLLEIWKFAQSTGWVFALTFSLENAPSDT